MEEPCETLNNSEAFHMSRYHSYNNHSPRISSPWLDLRVFYVRISNFTVEDSTPEALTINHIPLDPDTLLEINGVRMSMYSEGCSSQLRRDRVDKKSEEATYVSTDNIRLNGSVKFEVYDKKELVLSGTLEMSDGNGFTGESKKQWNMTCEAGLTAGSGFLKEKSRNGQELLPALPTIEVYVTGCFSGTPIILTKTLQLGLRKKQSRRMVLDSIPEYETAAEPQKDMSSELDQIPYPFGIKTGCYLDNWYEIECRNATFPFLVKMGMEVVDISIPGDRDEFYYKDTLFGAIRIKSPITSVGCSRDGIAQSSGSVLNMTDSPFFFGKGNRLVAVGCNSKASLTHMEPIKVACELNCNASKETSKTIPFFQPDRLLRYHVVLCV
ncbi:hypothetical protein F2Q69_00027110 [Brassica cretica]|uniref:Uncharacterized protein n=1 Tax=Brassica cretica TaxID=69181 RepID=A0A8S9RWD1_BRACR|nr:hypothetical protein F2Q69_00027110 [Brassica cretica]